MWLCEWLYACVFGCGCVAVCVPAVLGSLLTVQFAVQMGTTDSPERNRGTAAIVAKTVMQEFYDEAAMREEMHDSALRRIQEMESRMARAEHVSAVLVKTSSPWTREERGRIAKSIETCLAVVSGLNERIGEIEIHSDKLGDMIHASASLGPAGSSCMMCIAAA